jgi:hypothetical protein
MPKYHVFLSHSHADKEPVQHLADRLVKEKLRPWLDRWDVVPGNSFQDEIIKGLEKADCCAICIGSEAPAGWFQKELQVVLNRQAEDRGFRVMAVLLPGATTEMVPSFLKANSWIDLRNGDPTGEQFYRFTCGIRNKEPGRYRPQAKPSSVDQAKPSSADSVLEKTFADIGELVRKGLLREEEADKARRRAINLYIDMNMKMIRVTIND